MRTAARYGNGVIYRLGNSGESAEECLLEVGESIKRAALVNALEEVLQKCPATGRGLRIEIPAHGVISVLAEFE